MLEIVLRLVAGLLLVGANAFFVAVEFALTRLPQLDLTPEDLAASPGLERAWSMTERLEVHLTGCQLGISAASLLLGVVAEPAVTELLDPLASAVGWEGPSVRVGSVVLAVVLLNLVHKIWGEQAPTYLGVERPRAVAERLAPVLYWWTRIMGPVIRFGDRLAKATLRPLGVEITRSWTTEGEPPRAQERAEERREIESSEGGREAEIRKGGRVAEGSPGKAIVEAGNDIEGPAELKRRMGELLTRGRLPRERRTEVIRALEIGELPAENVMVPSEEIVTLTLGAPAGENLARIAAGGHVRYPVVEAEGSEGSAHGTEGRGVEAGKGPRTADGRIVGVVYVPALFDPPERLRGDRLELEDLLEPPAYVAPDTPVSKVIDRLQEARQEIALVTDDGTGVGELRGIVTVMDAFEAIAGEVEDPLDREGADR